MLLTAKFCGYGTSEALETLAALGPGVSISLLMLRFEQVGNLGPLVVMVHWLGGSSRSWRETSGALAHSGFRCFTVDLPGFGEDSAETTFSISEMVQALIETIRSLKESTVTDDWILVGHSMGGKLATVVGRRAEDGVEGLDNLKAIVLVSSSPPGPEPMTEKNRSRLRKSLGRGDMDPEKRRKNAEAFVDDNTGRLPLNPDVRQRSVDDVLRMNPDALVSWLNDGSKEDWSDQVGRLKTPTLVLAGTVDEALGPEAQKADALPHLEHATLVSLEGGGHLAPLERPGELADRIAEFLRDLGVLNRTEGLPLGSEFSALIASSQTSPQTRAALLERLTVESHRSGVLAAEELRTLRALAACVIPGAPFDSAARIDAALAKGIQDGWRFDLLPENEQAWKQGIFSIDAAARREFGVPFVALDTSRQEDLLNSAQQGKLRKGLLGANHIRESGGAFDANQMRDWFEDVRAELAKSYVADPRIMERIGFTGFADEYGFTHISLDDLEGNES